MSIQIENKTLRSLITTLSTLFAPLRASTNRFLFLSALALSAIMPGLSAWAGTATWDGLNSALWNADNWTGGGGTGGAPIAGDTLSFAGTNRTATILSLIHI